MGNLSRFVRPNLADGPSQSSLDNIRRVQGEGEAAPRTGRTDVKRSMAQSPNVSHKQDLDRGLPLGVARELMRTPEGRMELQAMFADLSPGGQENFLLSVASQTRDPRSPAKGFAMTEEGNAIQDLVLTGGTAPETQEFLKRYRHQVDGDPVGYQNLSEMPSVEDATEKSAPFKPKVKTKDKEKFGEIKDLPSFRSTEKTTLDEDGQYSVRHSDVNLGRQTHAAIKRAEAGYPVSPIDSDTALQEDTSPLKVYTQTLNRVAELGDPHTGVPRRSEIDFDGLETMGVPRSVLAPGGGGGPARSSLATVRPQDHGDLMRLARAARIANPNEFDSAEDFARALVARAPQEPYNVTPVTASQRASATEAVGDLLYDPDGAVAGRTFGGPVPPGSVPPAAVHAEVSRYEPEAVSAVKHAERALVQQQVIEAIARKAEQVFGHRGWGANYKPASGTAGIEPSTETGMRAGTTQDPNQIPREGARDWRGMPSGIPNQRAVSDTADTIPAPFKAGRQIDSPGIEVGEDVDAEDLVDLDERRRFVTGDPNAKGTEVTDGSEVLPGRAYGDKLGTKPSKAREEGGHKAGAYQDETDFAPHNSGANATPEALAQRQKFYDEAGGQIPGGPNAGQSYRLRDVMPMSTERTSVLRQQMQDLIDANPQPGPVVIDQIAELQRRLNLSQRLDQMSGIRSFRDTTNRPDPLSGSVGDPDGINGASPADDASLPSSNLVGANQDLAIPGPPPPGPDGTVWYRDESGRWVKAKPFDLNGRAVDDDALDAPVADADGAGQPPEPPKRIGVLDPNPEPDPMSAPPTKGMSRIKRILIGLGLAGGGLAAYQASQDMSQPEPDAFPSGPTGGPAADGEGNIVPATSEDRIRTLQRVLGRARLNPNTQTPSSMVR